MVFVIAEIGTNHMGDIKIAKKLIDVAKNAGCDAVKFQKKSVEKIYSDEDFLKFASKFRPLVMNQENRLMTPAPWTP